MEDEDGRRSDRQSAQKRWEEEQSSLIPKDGGRNQDDGHDEDGVWDEDDADSSLISLPTVTFVQKQPPYY